MEWADKPRSRLNGGGKVEGKWRDSGGFHGPRLAFGLKAGQEEARIFRSSAGNFGAPPEGRSRVEASTWGGGTVEGRWRGSRGPGGGKVEVRGPSCGGIVVAGRQRADGIRVHALAWRCGASGRLRLQEQYGATVRDACEAGMGGREKRAMTAGLPLHLYQACALPWWCRLLPPIRSLALPPRWRWRAGRRWCRSQPSPHYS